MRDILTALAIVVILTLTGALVGPHFVDWTQHRTRIEDEMGRRLGVPVRVRGDIAVRLLPAPRVSLSRVELKDHGADRAMVSVERLDAEIAPMPLLKGEIRVVEATVEGPRVALDALRANTGGERLAAFLKNVAPDALAIDRLTVRDALLLPAEDAASQGRVLRFSGEFVAAALAGPWRGSGIVTVADRRMEFQLSTGVADADASLRLKAGLLDTETGVRADFEGVARLTAEVADPVKLDGRIVATGPAAWLGAAPEAPGWKIVATGVSSGPAFVARNVEIEAGADGFVKLEGEGRIDLSRGMVVALDLKAGQLDLDRLGAAFGAPAGPPDPARMARGLAALPFALDLKLALDRVLAGGEAHGPLAARAQAGLGRLAVEEFALELAAQTKLWAEGQVIAGEDPVAQGTLRLSSGDPGRAGIALLHLKGTDPIAMAMRAAGPAEISGRFLADRGGLSISDAEIRFGESRLVGDLRFRPPPPQGRARVEARLKASRLDLDLIALLAPEAGPPVDVSLALEAETARAAAFGARDLGRLTLRLRSEAGALDIERLELAGSGAAKVAVFGRIDAAGGRVTAEVDTPDMQPIVDLARPVLPPVIAAALTARATALSPAKLTAAFERKGAEATTLRLVGVFAGTRLDSDIAFAATAPAGDPLLGVTRAKVQAHASDARALIAQLGAPTRTGRAIGAGDLRLELATEGETRPWTLAVALGDTTFAASVKSSTRPDDLWMLGAVTLRSPDARPVLAALGWPLAAVSGPLGLELSAVASPAGGALSLSRIAGRFGGKPLGGTLTVAPGADGLWRIGGDLGLDRVSLAELAQALAPDQFPALSGRAATAVPFPAFRPLPAMLDLKIGAARLDIAAGLFAERARLHLKSDADGFEIAEAAADFSRGRAALKGRLRRDGPRFAANARVELTGAELAQMLPRGLAEGRADVTLDVAATGESEAALIATLGGGGEATVADLVVRGLDPAGLRRAILSVDPDGDAPQPEPFLAKLAAELAAGPLAARRYATPLGVSGGVLRAGPASLDLPAASVQATVTINLATGARDGRVTLTSAGEIADWSGPPPQIVVTLGGTLAAPMRGLDAAATLNAMTVRAVQREIARVEAMEADQRERSAQNRLLRAFREADQREAELRAFIEELEREEGRIARLREATQAFTRRFEAERRAAERARGPRIHDPEGLASEMLDDPPTAAPGASPRTVVTPSPPPRPRGRAAVPDSPLAITPPPTDAPQPAALPRVTSPPRQLLPSPPGLRPAPPNLTPSPSDR